MRYVFVGISVLAGCSLIGCSGADSIVARMQNRELSSDAAIRVAEASFGASAITVRGNVSTAFHAPPGGTGVLVVHSGDGKFYAFATAGTKEMVKQGFSRFSVGPGDDVTVSGVLAQNGETIDGMIVARADSIVKMNGKKLFARRPPGS